MYPDDLILPKAVIQPAENWLVVDDEEMDCLLFRRACARAFNRRPILNFVSDGVAAKTYLSNLPEPPNLIISDLVMPRVGGLELLAWVRGRPSLQHAPFVILSGSDYQGYEKEARDLGVTYYSVKPETLEDLVVLMKHFHELTKREVRTMAPKIEPFIGARSSSS